MMSPDYYADKARDIVWGCIDNIKLIDDDKLEKSITGIVAKLLETIGELDERVSNLERRNGGNGK